MRAHAVGGKIPQLYNKKYNMNYVHHIRSIIITPGITNRTFGNRTQLNSIRGLSSIEFGNRTKSNGRICVSLISGLIELNRTQSNGLLPLSS